MKGCKGLLLRKLVNVAGGPSLRYHWDDLYPESADFMSMDLVHFIFDGASDQGRRLFSDRPAENMCKARSWWRVTSPAKSCHCMCVCVCVCSLLSLKIGLRWRSHYMLSVSNQMSGADCFNVLSWLLFLRKLAKRLHISN